MSKGIHLHTEGGFSATSTTATTLALGASQALVAGPATCVNMGVTNNVYGGEYIQTDMNHSTHLTTFSSHYNIESNSYNTLRSHYALRKLESIQSHYRLAVQHLESCESRVNQARCNFDFNDLQTSKHKLETAKADLAMMEQDIVITKNNAVSEQKKIISRVSESKIERAKAAVIEHDVQMVNNKLTII